MHVDIYFVSVDSERKAPFIRPLFAQPPHLFR